MQPNCSSTSIAKIQAGAVFSWIEPALELSFEALEHLFFDVFDVSELAPPSHITVVRRALNLYDKLFQLALLILGLQSYFHGGKPGDHHFDAFLVILDWQSMRNDFIHR